MGPRGRLLIPHSIIYFGPQKGHRFFSSLSGMGLQSVLITKALGHRLAERRLLTTARRAKVVEMEALAKNGTLNNKSFLNRGKEKACPYTARLQERSHNPSSAPVQLGPTSVGRARLCLSIGFVAI